MFVGIGHAQKKNMNHQYEPDSTHQKKMDDQKSMKMHDHESMKMSGYKTMKEHKKMDKIMEEKLVYYTCPMESHKHIQSAEPGKCPECGMKLMPMRLKKS